ncbi:MAG: caspase family protein [Nitrospinales bacterium]
MRKSSKIGRPLILTLLFTFVWGISHSFAVDRGLKVVSVKSPTGKHVGLYKESHALVIGVSDYAKWPVLPGVMDDISAVEGAFQQQGFQVEMVKNPDRDGIISAIESFINKHGHDENNRLAFYFAGHGHTLKLAYGGEMGYFVPQDAPNPNMDKKGFMAKAMDMQQIEVYAKRIEAKHALFIFDSCFSGSIFSLSRAAPEHISYKTGLPVRQFITAGSAEEKVPDESIFRRQFVKALDGEADIDTDGYVTGLELGEFLQKTVINYSKGSQHPQYGAIRNPDLDKGDFVFIMKDSPSTGTDLAELDLIEEELEQEELKLQQQRKILEKEKMLAAKRRGIEEERKKLTEEKELLQSQQDSLISTGQSPPAPQARDTVASLSRDVPPVAVSDESDQSQQYLIDRVMRTAKLGDLEMTLRHAITKELNIPHSQIRREASSHRHARAMFVDVVDLLPNSGPARISYLFPKNRRRLVAVEIAWRWDYVQHGIKPLPQIGKTLSEYLIRKGQLKSDQIIGKKLKDGSFVYFRNKNDKGRVSILRLSGGKIKPDTTPSERAEILKQRKLVLSYTDTATLSNLKQQRKKKLNRSRR